MKQKRQKQASLYRKFQESAKEEKIKMPSVRKKRHSFELPRTVGICSLKNGCGCSHMAYALGNFMAEKKKRVYVVTKDPSMFAKGKMGYGADINNFEEYDHIIYDSGMFEKLSLFEQRELSRCEKKVMLCLNNDIYLERLADFISHQVRAIQSWAFLFNFSAKEEAGEIYDLMEEYKCACIPLFQKEDSEAAERLMGKVW